MLNLEQWLFGLVRWWLRDMGPQVIELGVLGSSGGDSTLYLMGVLSVTLGVPGPWHLP